MEESRWERLGNGVNMLVDQEYGFTMDTLLLADFSLPGKGEACADLGTGCGVIPLLWAARSSPRSVLGVELRQKAARLAQRSVEENGFSGLVRILCGDLREYKAILPHQGLDRIACNPPYYPLGAGPEGKGEGHRIARQEETFTLKDLRNAARYSLRFGGRLCLCLPAFRLGEAVSLFREGNLEPKRLRLVQSRREKAPYLFLLECLRGGKSGLEVLPTLVAEEAPGVPTRELMEIYGEYKN